MGFAEDTSTRPTIPQYFKGKTIFITGGSGFMGKILIEKLLYSCPDLDRIYLLLRSKRGVKPEDRLESIYSTQCFNRLRKEKPTIFHSKVFVVAGDATEEGLGLSEEDRTLLVNRVNVVFHVAASVRFDDPLPFAVNFNLRGTRRVVELCKEMRDLSVLVHVSTSYSNTNRDPIEEVLYPPLADWRDTVEVCEKLDEHTIRVLTPKYLGEMPNTYTFTKQLAEHVVHEERDHLPVVIFRPSIVISSVSEPMPGWVENFNGPVGLLVASGKGIMRSLHTDPSIIADYMPVDVAIKSMIAAAWDRGTKQLEPTAEVPIYNCCAGNLNNITMGEMIDIGYEINDELPLNDSLWYPGGSITKCKFMHYMKVILLHLLPAILVDTLLRILGRKPMLVKVQRRIYIANLALHYYTSQQWTFANKNLIALRSRIKDADHEAFYYEIENVDRYEFFYSGVYGGRKYLLKEKDEDIPKAQQHNNRMWLLHVATSGLFYGLIAWKVIYSNYVKYIIDAFFNIIF